MVFAHAAHADAWQFHAHPDVWALMLLLLGGYFYALKRLGPSRVAPTEPVVTPTQRNLFLLGIVTLWVGADWPMHDVSENYLFSAHMVQHTLFALVAPPLLLLGIPPWLLRTILGRGRLFWIARRLTRPVPAFLLFNGVIAVTHWPAIVNMSVSNEPAHFGLHFVLVSTALLMWWPVLSPLPELASLSPPAKLLYLFLQSILPTVPASFLTFADGVLYEAYAQAPRVFGVSALNDQMIAGLIMKVGGGLLLWTVIAVLFFRWAAEEEKQQVEELDWTGFERELEAWNLRK